MCVIIQLPSGKTVPEKYLFNAAANNWHSWGIIVRKADGTLDVHKNVPKLGTHSDLDQIKDILETHKDCERLIHFRHNTRGETNLSNTHPFLAFNQKATATRKGRAVWFMHNGTFLNYGKDTTSPKSDTAEFVEQFLAPALNSFHTEKGSGDLSNAMLRLLIETGFEKAQGSNRGLLISTDHEPIRLGTWVRFDHAGNTTYTDASVAYYASNDEYFKEIKRGPVHEAMQEEKKKKEAEDRKLPVTTSNERKPAAFDKSMFQPDTEIFTGLQAYFGDGLDLTDDESLSRLAFVTKDEFERYIYDLIESNSIKKVACFIEHLTLRFYHIWNQLEEANEPEVTEKKEAA